MQRRRFMRSSSLLSASLFLPNPAGSTVPINLRVEERVHPVENNGFSILEIDVDSIEIKQFAWLPAQGPDAIDSLMPFSAFRLLRG